MYRKFTAALRVRRFGGGGGGGGFVRVCLNLKSGLPQSNGIVMPFLCQVVVPGPSGKYGDIRLSTTVA